MDTTLLSFIVVNLVAAAFAKNFPSDIERCSISDPKLDKCIFNRVEQYLLKFNKGRADIALISLEPLYVEKIDLGTVTTLTQVYTKVNIHGLPQSKVSNFDANISDDNCFIKFFAVTPILRWTSDYHLTGKILLFKLDSTGFSNHTLSDVGMDVVWKCEKHFKKNKKFLRLTGVDIKLDPKSIHFFFDNIVPENPEISARVLETLNENSLEIFNEMKSAFQQAFGDIFKQIVNNVFDRFSQDVLFLP